MKMPREFYVPKNAVEIKAPDGVDAVGYVYSIGEKRWGGLGFGGKRSKPDWHYSFKDEASARKRVEEHFANARKRAEFKADLKAKAAADRCVNVADVYAKALKSQWISHADAAICLRAQLASKFPGVKFSVRSDSYSGGSSIDVSYVDGPAAKAVEAVACRYSFGGFDGMIDLAYCVSRWLAKDGSMSLAHSQGSAGSGGCHSEDVGDPHDPSAVEVRGGAKHVFVKRGISKAVKRELANAIAAKYGVEAPPADDVAFEQYMNRMNVPNAPGVNGEYMATLVYRASNGIEV